MFSKVFSFLALGFFLWACEKQEQNTLVIGTSGDNPPFEFYQNSDLVGFDIDLGKEIAKRLNKEVKFMEMPFDSLIAALQSKKVDMVLSAMNPTEERKKTVDFSQNYHVTSFVLITAGITTAKDLSHLNGKKVGVLAGSTWENYAKTSLSKTVPGMEVLSLGKGPDIIQALRTGRISGLITGVSEADRILTENPSFKTISLPDSTDCEAVVLPKGSSLIASVDEIIINMEAEGSLGTLRHKWGLN